MPSFLTKRGNAYPVTTNSNIQNKVNRVRRKRIPHALHTDPRSRNLEELVSVKIPSNRLARPAARATIPDRAPSVPALVGEADRSTNTVRLTARAVRVYIAMNSTVARQDPIHRLHDIDLSARGPRNTIADTSAQHPERGPDALFIRLRVIAEPDLRLGHGLRSRRRRERVRALDAGGGPGPAAVLARHDLHGVSAAELQVLVRGRVCLHLVVDFQARDDVPVARVDGGACGAAEGLRPYVAPAAVARRGLGRDGGCCD